MISTAAFLALAVQCAPDIAPDTLARVVKTESGFNQWAIGVVGKPLVSQPQTKEEALSVVKKLVKENANFSIGLGQINRQYFDANDAESVFEPCSNLKMASAVLKDCYSRALDESDTTQQALKKTFSCYYSGNFIRGFKKEGNNKSYVELVVANNVDVKVPALSDENIKSSPANERPTYDSWDVLQQYPKYGKPAQNDEPDKEKTKEEQPDVKS